MKNKNPDLQLEMAPQEAIKFNAMIIDFFIIKILGIKNFMITDESYVSDMLSFRSQHGVQVDNDYWEFTQIFYESQKVIEATGKHLMQLSKKERAQFAQKRVTKLHRSEVCFDEVLLLKIKELFGVEIEAKFLDGSFVDLGMAISQKLSPQKRQELMQAYPNL